MYSVRLISKNSSNRISSRSEISYFIGWILTVKSYEIRCVRAFRRFLFDHFYVIMTVKSLFLDHYWLHVAIVGMLHQ